MTPGEKSGERSGRQGKGGRKIVLITRVLSRCVSVALSLSACLPEMAAKSVVVIGAGPAGITAARLLKEQGVGDVTIVEACSHTGGRVYTNAIDADPEVRAFSAGMQPLELGPEFLHGDENNMFLDWIKKHGVAGKPNVTTLQASLRVPCLLVHPLVPQGPALQAITWQEPACQNPTRHIPARSMLHRVTARYEACCSE